MEIEEVEKQQLNFGSEIIETVVQFTFTNFILVMDEGVRQFVVLTKEMKVDLEQTNSRLNLEMSLLDFEVKRKHEEEDVKFVITSDYDSSISAKIFKKNIIQKQRKLINISFKQEKDKPQEAKVYFGCLFITLEPRIIKEFVDCITNSLKNKKDEEVKAITKSLSNDSVSKTSKILDPSQNEELEKLELSPQNYAYLENSEKKKDKLEDAIKSINMEVTIENISLLLVSTVNNSFIPLAQIMVEGGRVDCGVFDGAILVDLKFQDLICLDLTNYPQTLTDTDFDKIKPMKLFGRLKDSESPGEGIESMSL